MNELMFLRNLGTPARGMGGEKYFKKDEFIEITLSIRFFSVLKST